MQIHELTEFQGMPGSGDFLAIDNGNRTQKIEAENLGVTTAMTTAEAEAGTSTAKRVMTPKMFHDYVEDNTARGFVELTQAEYDALTQEEKNDGRVFFITDGTPTPSPYILACYPVGSYFETSDTNFDPNTEFGGTWELIQTTDDETWQTLTSECRYFKKGGVVTVTYYTASRTITSSYQTVATLPVKYRPAGDLCFSVMTVSAVDQVVGAIQANGNIMLRTANGSAAYAGFTVSFPVVEDTVSGSSYRWHRTA